MFGAKGIEHRAALHTELCLKRAGRIIASRMDHLAVAGAYPSSRTGFFLEKNDILAEATQLPGYGKPDNAGADNRDIKTVHTQSYSNKCARGKEPQLKAESFSERKQVGFLELYDRA